MKAEFRLINPRWIQQQTVKVGCMANQDAVTALQAEIDAAKADHERTLTALASNGFIRNTKPFTAKDKTRVQGGDGFIRKDDAGKWIGYTKAEALAWLKANAVA